MRSRCRRLLRHRCHGLPRHWRFGRSLQCRWRCCSPTLRSRWCSRLSEHSNSLSAIVGALVPENRCRAALYDDDRGLLPVQREGSNSSGNIQIAAGVEVAACADVSSCRLAAGDGKGASALGHDRISDFGTAAIAGKKRNKTRLASCTGGANDLVRLLGLRPCLTRSCPRHSTSGRT